MHLYHVCDVINMEDDEKTGSYATYYNQKGTTIVHVRIPQALNFKMEMWVDNGEFKSRSELVVSAVRHYLDYLSTRKTTREIKESLERDILATQNRK